MHYDFELARKRHDRRIKKACLSKVSFMNTSKWIKLFQAIEYSDISLQGETIKLIESEHIARFSLKNDGFYCIRGYTADRYNSPFHYKEIEWIFVPAVNETERWNRNEKLKTHRDSNDVHALKELIDSLGQFEYDFDENGLKIYGYK
jgi:hypothetical protein